MISWHTPDKTPREPKAPSLRIQTLENPQDHPPTTTDSPASSPLDFIFAENELQISHIIEYLPTTNSLSLSPPYQIIILDLPIWKDPEVIFSPRNITVAKSAENLSDIPAGQSLFHAFFEETPNLRIRITQRPTQAAYFDLIKKILLQAKLLLTSNGLIVVKSLDRCRHALKVLLDDVLGYEKFLNEVIISSPFCSSHDGVFQDMTGSLFLYYRDTPPSIIPQYKNKKSGGYWHSLHSEGQGPSKKFLIFNQAREKGNAKGEENETGIENETGKQNKKEIEIELSPPIGTHWKYNQTEIYRMCRAGEIKLTKNNLPVYWVKEKMGFIVDNNWLDLPSHYLDVLGFTIAPVLIDRIISTFSQPNDKILHIFHGLEKAGIACAEKNRRYVGIDVYPPLHNLLIQRSAKTQFIARFYQAQFYPKSSNSLNKVIIPTDPVVFTPSLQAKSSLNWSILFIEHYHISQPQTVKDNAQLPLTPYHQNRLYWGDNLNAISHIRQDLLHSFQLIYIDPPFFTGVDEVINIPVSPTSAPIEDIAYQNTTDMKNPVAAVLTFTQWLFERVTLMRDLLRETGFLALRLDYHFGHYAKLVLDRVFGSENFLGELLVRRMTKNLSMKALHTQNKLIVQHDSIFLYRKSSQAQFLGVIQKVKRSKGDEIETECAHDNIWLDIDGYEKKKRTLYPTENSKALLERIITLCTKPGDLVGDFFAGSGTTLYTAAIMQRTWVGADVGAYAVNEMRKLLLSDAKLQKIWVQQGFDIIHIGSSEITQNSICTQFNVHLQIASDHTIILQLDEDSNHPLENPIKKELHADSNLDLLDFIAIDWNYQKDRGFSPADYSIRIINTKHNKAILKPIPRQFSYTYSTNGHKQLGILMIDIYGKKYFQIHCISMI